MARYPVLTCCLVPEPVETSFRTLRRRLILLALAVLALAAVDRAVRTLWLEQALPSADIFWIWDDAVPREPASPHAFQAMREFDLADPPKKAMLLVQADEEYRIFLNGRWVGTGTYDESEWHAYPVGRWLRRGKNLLVAELRSGRGVGGLLLCLAVGDDECAVTSDGGWLSFSEYQPRLARGEHEGDGRPVRVWGRAGTGRWPLPSVRGVRPLAASCIDTTRPIEAHRVLYLRDEVLPGPGPEISVPVWSARWRLFAKGVAVVRMADEEAEVGKVVFGRKRRQAPDPSSRGVLVTQPGQPEWVMPEGQWFQYMEIQGPERLGEILYWPIADREECSIYFAPDRRSRPRGLLGVAPPRSRTPVDDELRRRNEGIAGVAGGE